MHAELLVLRFIHVVGGIIWVGSAFLTFFYLMPAVQQAGAAGGQVMANMQKRGLLTLLPVVAIVTILSGLRLLMIVSGGSDDYFRSSAGQTFAMSGVLAIIAFILGVAISRPAVMKMARLRQEVPPDDAARARIQSEIQVLQRRAGITGTIVTWMLFLAAVGMAVARYL